MDGTSHSSTLRKVARMAQTVAGVGGGAAGRVARFMRRLAEPLPGPAPSVRQAAAHPEYGIDWMLKNVETGRFERSLSLLSGVGAMVASAEIFFEHDRASFGNRLMWLPVALGPFGLAAGVAGFANKRAAKTALPAVSALIVINGLQGTYLHARGIKQRPGGWGLARYNMEMGPPLLAPLLLTVVGGMGLLAAVLRREGS